MPVNALFSFNPMLIVKKYNKNFKSLLSFALNEAYCFLKKFKEAQMQMGTKPLLVAAKSYCYVFYIWKLYSIYSIYF